MSIRVLIAEDDASLRDGLVDLLEAEGYAVITAENGQIALDRFSQEKPDLVILDVMMPEMSGYDVCRELRKQDSQTPVIMLTAKGEEIDKVVGLELGADDYVTKPLVCTSCGHVSPRFCAGRLIINRFHSSVCRTSSGSVNA